MGIFPEGIWKKSLTLWTYDWAKQTVSAMAMGGIKVRRLRECEQFGAAGHACWLMPTDTGPVLTLN
jgi:hypothetical protein